MIKLDNGATPAASGTILAGGLALILGAFAFLGVFSYLATKFNYPDVLDGSAEAVLPALLATGAGGRAVWALYSVLPLAFLPAGVAAYEALRERAAGPARVGMLFAVVAAVSMVLGLMRWPSVHWELAQAWETANSEQRVVLAAMFDGLNRYLGNYVGEFLGELAVNLFFGLAGVGLLRRYRAPRWLGWWGIVTAGLGLVGVWRNVTPVVDPVTAVNNYLLPAWMIGFGLWLCITGRRVAHS